VDSLRELIPGQVGRYVDSDSESVLLIRVPAGVGKTHAAVQAVQRVASDRRILYTAARHNFLADLQAIPGFNPSLWYHWLPIHLHADEHDPIPTTCRFAPAQLAWLKKGYPAFDLCRQLCVNDKHIAECPYRLQRRQREPIVFAMHNHLSSGLAIDDFGACIVDELPLQAFVGRRHVPSKGLDVGATGPLGELVVKLGQLVGLAPKRLAGRDLFDQIGPTLREVYAQAEILPEMLPQVPRVYNSEMVGEVPYYYVLDFLRLASNEYDAWRNGWPRWAERVWLDPKGLNLLDRKKPWAKLPRKLVVLDATGQAPIYRALFDREVEVYEPRVKRPGRVYQVVHRLNGVGSLLAQEEGQEPAPTQRARQLVQIAGSIASRYQGRTAVVTHKRLVSLFATAFGEANTLHFHALRGTNALQDVDCLIVAGGPSPTLQGVVDAATALAHERVKSFVAIDDKGKARPVWTTALREYAVSEELRAAHGGLVPWRAVGGFWTDPDLTAVYDQLREQELVQAIHRARPNIRPCDVWVLTSIPTSEPLDGFFDEPPLGPEGIHWAPWLKLQPWLEEQLAAGQSITNQAVAGAAGVSERWALDQKWLAAIVGFDARWRIDRLVPETLSGGRPKLIAVPQGQEVFPGDHHD
jgi:hypothetical protein